jgi:hypothetical protein
MKKQFFGTLVVLTILLIVAAPVTAIAPDKNAQGTQFQDIWTAITDLQNKVAALTKRVDDIPVCPAMPEYRAGSYTTPPTPPEIRWGYPTQTVTFSSPMPDTNYRVSITNTNTEGMFEYASGLCANNVCFFTIDSKTTTGFTFSARYTLTGDVYSIGGGRTFDYIAIADN